MAMASGEVEIASETLRVESKVYYADLRANGRGAYVRLSERAGRAAAQPPPPAEGHEDGGAEEEGGPAGTAAGAAVPSAAAFRNSVCLPGVALQWFAAVLDYFVSCTPSSNRELPVENKIFYFELGENNRGKFLRISEAGAGPRGRSSLIVPSGASPESPTAAPAWVALRDVLLRAQAAAYDYHFASGLAAAGVPPPPPPTPAADPRLVAAIAGPSSVVGPGPAPPTITPTPSGGSLVRAGHKRFFFDAGANAKGGYLRVSEVAGSDRTSIIIPAWALPQCVAAAGAFLGPLCGPGGGPAAAAAGGALAAAGGVGGPPLFIQQQHQQQQQVHHHHHHNGWGEAGPGYGGGGASIAARPQHQQPPRKFSPPQLLPHLDSLSLAPGGPTAARASAAVAAAAAAAANHRAAAVAAATAAMAPPVPVVVDSTSTPPPLTTPAAGGVVVGVPVAIVAKPPTPAAVAE